MDSDKQKDPSKDKHPPVLEEDDKTQQSASLDVAVDEAQVEENKENKAIEKKKENQTSNRTVPSKVFSWTFQERIDFTNWNL